MLRSKQPGNLVRRLTRNLVVSIGILLLALIVSLLMSGLINANQKSVDERKIRVGQDVDGILRSLTDQETGLRGYVLNTDVSFLQPFNDGRTRYEDYVQNLKNEIRESDLKNTGNALTGLEERVNDWYNNIAQVQISRVQRGGTDLEAARSPGFLLDAKNRFDNIRQAQAQLGREANNDLNRLQSQVDLVNLTILVFAVLIAFGAVFASWRAFTAFIGDLRLKLDQLMDVTDRLEQGDLSARVANLTDDELGRLGLNFNNMAAALQRQQDILKQRDIQDGLLRLTNVLNATLELEDLLDNFLKELLRLLQIQVGTVYLYNPASNLLSLAAVQGLNRKDLQPVFTLGEGLPGRAAQDRAALTLTRPSTEEAKDYEIQTILGKTLPATLFHLPLTRGEELVGVLSIGSLYPLSENSRNLVEVVSTYLAAAISNAGAYRRIQSQADELERRRHELERNNEELSRQRDELASLNSALAEANRLRSQFLSTMSHELRTPLTAIIGFSQLLLRGGEVVNFSQRQKTNLDRILKNGQHLLALVNDVLDISKIEAGRMEIAASEVNLTQFLDSLIEQTQSLALQKKLTLKQNYSPNIGAIETDPERLRQILLNLLSNALKFTEKGEVCLTASAYEPPLAEKSAALGWVTISVKDTGIGIPPEQQRHIFDEFYQVDSGNNRKYGGTGLGLSIVRRLTELLGGKLEVDSQPGRGSTFTILLPRKFQPPAEYFERASRPGQFSAQAVLLTNNLLTRPEEDGAIEEDLPAIREQGKRLVLAVDDDPDVVELIHSALEGTTYHVVGLHNPEKVKTKVAELKPYAVTLDVMMPESNGWQILQELKSDPATAEIPVIMLTVVSDRSAGFLLGANDYLVKPIDRDLLLKTLDRLAQHPATAGADGTGENNRDRRSVLIVDDEPDIRSMLDQLISEAGYSVRTAAGGLEALRLVKEARPDLILLDLMMPDLDGFEVLNRLKENPETATIPVVILTAKTLTAEDYERLKWGADRIIRKGSRPLVALLDELENLLKKVNL